MNQENLRKEFEEVMESEKIFEFHGERRLYGFLFEYKGEGRGYITVEGRIPLPLAEKINCDPLNKMRICVNGGREDWTPLDMVEHDEKEDFSKEEALKLISEGKSDEMYICYYHISYRWQAWCFQIFQE